MTTIEEISVQQLKEKMDKQESFILIDVREPHEFELCKIEGAILIPLGSLESELSQLDKSADYVIQCRLGGRSAKGVEMMKKKGFESVVNLAGGITKWAQEIEPSMPTY